MGYCIEVFTILDFCTQKQSQNGDAAVTLTVHMWSYHKWNYQTIWECVWYRNLFYPRTICCNQHTKYFTPDLQLFLCFAAIGDVIFHSNTQIGSIWSDDNCLKTIGFVNFSWKIYLSGCKNFRFFNTIQWNSTTQKCIYLCISLFTLAINHSKTKESSLSLTEQKNVRTT